jgi:hypothetical protein
MQFVEDVELYFWVSELACDLLEGRGRVDVATIVRAMYFVSMIVGQRLCISVVNSSTVSGKEPMKALYR